MADKPILHFDITCRGCDKEFHNSVEPPGAGRAVYVSGDCPECGHRNELMAEIVNGPDGATLRLAGIEQQSEN